MTFIEKLRMLAEWAPLLGQLQTVMVSQSPQDKAQAIIDAAQFAATKSPTVLDDEFLVRLEAILRSDEGQAMFAWVLDKFFSQDTE